jgi:tRNA pseudouridine38-40 synthase
LWDIIGCIPMIRYKCTVHYAGTHYNGWQLQAEGNTIQGMLEQSLTKLNKFERVPVTGSGRTDTGVHALAQICHFDLKTRLSIRELINAINSNLPADIRVIDLIKVNKEFHARFSVIHRQYRYQCYYGSNLLFRNQTWKIRKIEIDVLNKTSRLIIGKHDFLSFSKYNPELDNTLCQISESIWTKEPEMLIYTIKGNRFLHHMVRYVVGTMIAIGENRVQLKSFEQLIQNPSKNVQIFKAPAQGLFLENVYYA